MSGHGPTIGSVAAILRKLIREPINTWDQSALMAELNEALKRNSAGDQYATAVVIRYCRVTSESVFTNAGHPAPLWHHASLRRWDWLETTASLLQSVEGLPLGLVPGASYVQRAVQLAPGDMLVIYTDGSTEARDATVRATTQDRCLHISTRDIHRSCVARAGPQFEIGFENIPRLHIGQGLKEPIKLCTVAADRENTCAQFGLETNWEFANHT